MAKEGTTTYGIRDVDSSLWEAFKLRAESEGHTMRWVIVELIGRYVKDGLK